MKLFLPTVCSVLLISVQACSSDGSAEVDNDAPIANQGNEVSVPASLPAAARSIIFDYTMPAVTGGSTTARAQLFEPNTQAPQDGHPLVLWAHGTTGISNACTPSASFERFGNATAINSLLSSGYAVLAPDYEGFGTPEVHPYYIRSSHANAVLSSIPAAHQLNDTNLSDDWAIVGHSQGGHVALATARAPVLPAYPLQAVVALAPGTDLKPLSERAFEAIDEKVAEGNFQNAAERMYYMNLYSAYVAIALREVNPSFNPSSIFGDTVAPLVEQAVSETICGVYANSVVQALNNHFDSGGTHAGFQGIKRDWYTQPEIASRLTNDDMGDEAQAAPLLIIQGDADRQIPIAATTAFVNQQRAVGTDVTYQIVQGAGHGEVSDSEFGRVITWLNEHFPAR